MAVEPIKPVAFAERPAQDGTAPARLSNAPHGPTALRTPAP